MSQIYYKNLEKIAQLARDAENLDEFYLAMKKIKLDNGDMALLNAGDRVVSLDDYIKQTDELINMLKKELPNQNKIVKKTRTWQEYHQYYTREYNVRQTVGNILVENNSDVIIKE